MNMSNVTLYAHPPTEMAERPSVEEVLKKTQHLGHATRRELDYFLENEEEIPCLSGDEEIDRSEPRLFCGTVEEDDRGNKYVMALYYRRNSWVTEKYWLSYPILPGMVFVLAK